MKFYIFKKILPIILFGCLHLPAAWAQGNRDFMRETGKIGVVTGVILVIFFGIVVWLFRLERKLTNIEHQIHNDK